jgi:hypothetical protein
VFIFYKFIFYEIFTLITNMIEKNRLNAPQTARLFSANLIEMQTSSCVTFWYIAHSDSMTDTSRLNVLIYNLADQSFIQAWSNRVSNDKSVIWRKGFFSYMSLNRHQIVFEAIRASDSTTSIAIDDIVVHKFSDCYSRITPPPSTTTQTQTQTQIPTQTQTVSQTISSAASISTTLGTNGITQVSNQATTGSSQAGNL